MFSPSVHCGTEVRSTAWQSAWQVVGVQRRVLTGFYHRVSAVPFVYHAFPCPSSCTHTSRPWFEYRFLREAFPGPLRPCQVCTSPFSFITCIKTVINALSSSFCHAGALESSGYLWKERRWFSGQELVSHSLLSGFPCLAQFGFLEPSPLTVLGDLSAVC